MSTAGPGSNAWLFISWIGYHGRSEDLAKQLRAHDRYVTGGDGNRLLRYWKQWRETTALVKRTEPDAIFVMQPPVLALWAVAIAARQSTLVIGDLHTGVFTDRKWSWAWKGIVRSLRRRAGAVIVTNESLARRCRARGVRTFVLDDAVPRRVGSEPLSVRAPGLDDLRAESYVLVPLAYAPDEPIDEILAAASADYERTWVFTGRAPARVIAKAPRNARFSGFVSNDDYNWLAANAGVILACTDEEDTMQRAGYEAVSWERPLVTSRMQVLTSYYGDAAEFADPSSASIYAAIKHAFARADDLATRMGELGVRKREEHTAALNELREFVSGHP